jgi:hypothetical protein
LWRRTSCALVRHWAAANHCSVAAATRAVAERICASRCGALPSRRVMVTASSKVKQDQATPNDYVDAGRD